jgi:glycosyltransferase involved in cell wall biosynthesis
LLAELILSPPAGFRIEPVRLSVDAGYVLARQFLCDFVGAPKGCLGADTIVEPAAGDAFFGLDHCRDRGPQLRRALRPFVERGVPVTLLLHDVLPLTHPQWFPVPVCESFADWLGVLSEIPCKVISVSAHSAAELTRVMRERCLNSPSGGVEVVTPGSDLPPTTPVTVLPQRDGDRARVLMVGTIEPRKAHAQALAAFEELWSQGENFELILAGKPGWQVEALMQRLREHPEQGRRLRWIEDADDNVLASLYADCDVLLMASRAEGYGLPIAEAGRFGCDLLLRDLPVFREVAGESARYFEGDTGNDIARSLVDWRRNRGARTTTARSWTVWAQAADAMGLATVSREAALDGHGARAGQENS